MHGLTCIHQPAGLCLQCQAAFDEDPSAWYEYGDHPEGLARWTALQAEIAADAAPVPPTAGDDSSIPF